MLKSKLPCIHWIKIFSIVMVNFWHTLLNLIHQILFIIFVSIFSIREVYIFFLLKWPIENSFLNKLGSFPSFSVFWKGLCYDCFSWHFGKKLPENHWGLMWLGLEILLSIWFSHILISKFIFIHKLFRSVLFFFYFQIHRKEDWFSISLFNTIFFFMWSE